MKKIHLKPLGTDSDDACCELTIGDSVLVLSARETMELAEKLTVFMFLEAAQKEKEI